MVSHLEIRYRFSSLKTLNARWFRRFETPEKSSQNMGSSIFACLGAALHSLRNPYFSQRTGYVSAKNHPALQFFEIELADRLGRLERSDDAAYLNVGWLCDGMSLVLFAHSSVVGLVHNLPTPITETERSLVENYMDDSVKLLDVCNVLKEVISDIQHYLMLVRYAIHCLDFKEKENEEKLMRARNALSECVEAIKEKDEEVSRQGHQRSKLETCSSLLRRMGENLINICVSDASKSNAVFNEMYAAKVTTIFICGVLAAALSVKPRRSLAILRVADCQVWSASLSRLQQKVKEEVEKRKAEGSVAPLRELERVDSSVKDLNRLLEKIFEEKTPSQNIDRPDLNLACDTLAKSSEDLQQGLSLLQQEIDELFRMLVAIRVDLLDALSHCES